MIKKSILLTSFIIILSSLSNYNDSHSSLGDDKDTILWSSKKKLTWQDFKGIPDTLNSIMLAGTCSDINFEYKSSNNLVTDYKVECTFIKSKSWTITDDAQILAHEQLHFDISELYARKIRKAFDSLKIKKNNFIENYTIIYESNIIKRNDLNKLYDSQVYGNNILQQRWIKKIESDLLKLKKYEYIQ